MRVLVIDDEQMIGRSLHRALCRDHEVVNAESAIVALEILSSDQTFDLVLCDLMMPGMTGMDLFDWISQHQPRLTDRMIFMTGGTYTKRARELIAKPGVLHLEKPFEMTSLKEMIAERCSHSSASEACATKVQRSNAERKSGSL